MLLLEIQMFLLFVTFPVRMIFEGYKDPTLIHMKVILLITILLDVGTDGENSYTK